MLKSYFMKNLLIYYFQILIPIPLMVWASTKNSKMFVMTLVFYLLYRYFIDGLKLYRNGIISNKERLYPFLSIRYFKELYFK